MSEQKKFTPTIEKNIPIPAKRGKSEGKLISWPFEQMEIGDSFLVPEWATYHRAILYLRKYKKEGKIPKSFTTKVVTTDGQSRVWRVS